MSAIRHFSGIPDAIVGDSKFSFSELDHLGWLKCDGRILNTAEFYGLYSVIGNNYGGSGSQFKLPDMRGRVPGASGLGAIRDDQNRVLSTRAKGQYAGEEVHQLTIPEMPIHNHDNTVSENGLHNHGGATGTGGFSADTANPAVSATTMGVSDNINSHTHSISNDGDHIHTVTIDNRGSDVPHNNIQPTLFLGNMFIFCGLINLGARRLQASTDII